MADPVPAPAPEGAALLYAAEPPVPADAPASVTTAPSSATEPVAPTPSGILSPEPSVAAAATEEPAGSTPPKEAKSGEEGGEVAPTAEPSSAPLTAESYKDLALPEGLVVVPALFDEFKSVSASLGIQPEKAPELLNLYKKVMEANAETALQTLRDQITTDDRTLRSDPEFQGERYDVASKAVGMLIEEFGSPAVREVLGTHGLGNNPALVKFLFSVAQALGEGTPTLTGGPPANNSSGKRTANTPGAILYKEDA